MYKSSINCNTYANVFLVQILDSIIKLRNITNNNVTERNENIKTTTFSETSKLSLC